MKMDISTLMEVIEERVCDKISEEAMAAGDLCGR
jgi:hypothetical protein